MSPSGRCLFLVRQLELVGPIGCLFGLGGLGWLVVAPAARPFRPLGWAVLVVAAVFAGTISRPYYLAPGFLMLFPAAGVALEGWLAWRGRAVATLAAAAIAVAAPLAKPLLSEDQYVAYAAALGVAPDTDEHKELGRLPVLRDSTAGRTSRVEVARGPGRVLVLVGVRGDPQRGGVGHVLVLGQQRLGERGGDRDPRRRRAWRPPDPARRATPPAPPRRPGNSIRNPGAR